MISYFKWIGFNESFITEFGVLHLEFATFSVRSFGSGIVSPSKAFPKREGPRHSFFLMSS